MTPALKLTGIEKRFGGIAATQNVEMSLYAGARHALIGPNGAGKTTLVNLITGVHRPDSGRIFLAGHDVTNIPQHRRVRLGLVRSFQITNLFASFTVLENIALAVAERENIGTSVRSARGFLTHIADEAYEIARRMRLGDVGLRKVTELAYGQQRLVELAIALGHRPTVLLLDEPAAGLPGSDHAIVLEVLQELPKNVAVLLIEHDMALVFGFAQTITVLAEGAVIATGSSAEIRSDPQVRRVYLGKRSR